MNIKDGYICCVYATRKQRSKQKNVFKPENILATWQGLGDGMMMTVRIITNSMFFQRTD
jgi:hypothetical protein